MNITDKLNDLKISDDYNQRINRGRTQKIYLVNRNVDDTSAKFDVMGTTGNIYSVKLSGSPTCTCPDFSQRKKRCKHIFFMLAKIFAIDNPNQLKFTTTEIEGYISKYKENIEKMTVKYNLKSLCSEITAKNIEDNCVICMDAVLNGEQYVYCKKSCGRCIHLDCHRMIIAKTQKCPYCLQKFVCSSVCEGKDEDYYDSDD